MLKRRGWEVMCKGGLVFFMVAIVTMGVVLPAHAQATGTAVQGADTIWSIISTNSGVEVVYRVVLSLIDLIIVVGLLVTAFANIFRIQINTYAIKQILPGLVIGIILANLSFFAMRLMYETSSILVQEVGVFTSQSVFGGTTGTNTIGNSRTATFLLRTFNDELIQSTYLNTPLPGTAQQAGTVVGAANIGEAFMALLVAVLILQWWLIPIILIWFLIPGIMMLVLIFLLFIREYILIILFMASPLAFFSFGLPPPFKNLGQQWWGFLWKWLLMGPVSMIVIAVGILFLHAMNTGGAPVNWADYFFTNGIAILLFYLAMRMPYTWGKFYGGINAAEEWAKYGQKGVTQAHRYAKKGVDLGINAVVARRFNSNHPALGLLKENGATSADIDRAVRDAKLDSRAARKIMDEAANNPERAARMYNAEINKKRAKELSKEQLKKRSKYNFLRAPEAAYSGWKKGQETQAGEEAWSVGKNDWYGKAGGKNVKFDKAFSTKREELQEIDDPASLLGDEELQKFMLATDQAGWTSEMRREFFVQAGAKSGIPLRSRIRDDAGLKQMMKDNKWNEEAMTGIGLTGNRLINGQVMRRLDLRSLQGNDKPSALLENELDVLKGVPGKTSVVFSASVGNGSASGGSTPPPIDPEIEAEVEKTTESIDASMRQAIDDDPQAYVKAAKESFTKSQKGLMDALTSSAQLDPARAAQLASAVYGMVMMGTKKVTPDQLKAAATKIGVNSASLPAAAIDQFVSSAHAARNVANTAAETIAPELAVQGQIAMGLGGHNLGDTKQQVVGLQKELEAAIADPLNNQASVIKIHQQLGQFTPELKMDNPEQVPVSELVAKSQEQIRSVLGAVNLAGNPDYQKAVQSGNEAIMSQVMQSVEAQATMAQHSIVEASKAVDQAIQGAIANGAAEAPDLSQNQELVNHITENLSTLPQFSEEYSAKLASAGAAEEQAQQLTEEMSRKLIATLQNGAPSAGGSAHVYIHAPNSIGAENGQDIREWLLNAMKDGFAKIQAPAVPSPTQSTESTVTVEPQPAGESTTVTPPPENPPV